jgi:hypothetical protein
MELRHHDDLKLGVRHGDEILRAHEVGAVLHRLLAQIDDGLVVDVTLAGQPVEHASHLTHAGAAGIESRRGLRDLVLDPWQVGLSTGQHRIGRGRRVESEGQLAGVAFRAQSRVRVGFLQGVAQPGDVHVERLQCGRSRRLDLAAQQGFLVEGTLDLCEQQSAGAEELPDSRLHMYARHVSQRASRRVKVGGHRTKPACRRTEPIAQRCEVTHQQAVDRRTRVGDKRIPLRVTRLGQRELVHLKRVAQDRGIDTFVGVHRGRVVRVKRRQTVIHPLSLIVGRSGTEIGQAVVVSMVTERRGDVGVPLEHLVKHGLGEAVDRWNLVHGTTVPASSEAQQDHRRRKQTCEQRPNDCCEPVPHGSEATSAGVETKLLHEPESLVDIVGRLLGPGWKVVAQRHGPPRVGCGDTDGQSQRELF